MLEGHALDQLRKLPDESFDACITSPPYWKQRDYKHARQVGQEKTPDQFIATLVEIFREVRRVLLPHGVLWMNLGDSYWRKQLVGIPWRTALSLQSDGWILRSEIIWHKLGGTPEAVHDRPSRNHEHIFLLSKNKTYFYDYNAILVPHSNPWAIDCIKKAQETGQTARPRSNPFSKEERQAKGTKGITRAEYGALMNPLGKNMRTVWPVKPAWCKEAHYAVYPSLLIEPCVRATPPEAVILDPFAGSGTTGVVALQNGRGFVGIELVPESAAIARTKLENVLNQGS
jgi:DNA modification methylase